MFVALRRTWGQDRVFFFHDDGTQKSLPRAWTDAADPDVFVTLAAGRSPFRTQDLVGLVELIDGLRGPDDVATCKADSAVSVRTIPPSEHLQLRECGPQIP